MGREGGGGLRMHAIVSSALCVKCPLVAKKVRKCLIVCRTVGWGGGGGGRG